MRAFLTQNKSPSEPKLNFIQAWTIIANWAFFRTIVHWQNPNQLQGGPSSFGGVPGQVYVGVIKQEKVLQCMNKRTCLPWEHRHAYWLCRCCIANTDHYQLLTAEVLLRRSCTQNRGKKRSGAPQSDGVGTASLGHLIHKGERRTAEKKNVYCGNRIKCQKDQGQSRTSCTKWSNLSFQNHTIKEILWKRKDHGRNKKKHTMNSSGFKVNSVGSLALQNSSM